MSPGVGIVPRDGLREDSVEMSWRAALCGTHPLYNQPVPCDEMYASCFDRIRAAAGLGRKTMPISVWASTIISEPFVLLAESPISEILSWVFVTELSRRNFGLFSEKVLCWYFIRPRCHR